MRRNTRLILWRCLLVAATLSPSTLLARGETGGYGGGGHFGGLRGAPMTVSGFHAGYGPGYHTAAFRGAHWQYPAYYGWGYPYYGYGVGLGFGLGYGMTAGYAYPYYGYGYSPYYGTTTYVVSNPVVTVSATSTVSQSSPKPNEYSSRGAEVFKSGDYESAVNAWRHAIVDEPRNMFLVLQLAHALFATGKYEEAAGATQAAMHQLPQADWGAVVARFNDFYGDPRDYTKQLQEMEKAIKANPANPALRFLAGYHYGYLGFHQQSVEQLNKALQFESRDDISRKLRDLMKAKLTGAGSSLPPAPAPAPDRPTESTAAK